jgi:hypothetical protein
MPSDPVRIAIRRQSFGFEALTLLISVSNAASVAPRAKATPRLNRPTGHGERQNDLLTAAYLYEVRFYARRASFAAAPARMPARGDKSSWLLASISDGLGIGNRLASATDWPGIVGAHRAPAPSPSGPQVSVSPSLSGPKSQ